MAKKKKRIYTAQKTFDYQDTAMEWLSNLAKCFWIRDVKMKEGYKKSDDTHVHRVVVRFERFD